MRHLSAAAWCAAALGIAFACSFLRPLLPVDETRYMTVAWEMWQSGNLLVPHLNHIPYSDKPPLLFWLVNLAWLPFGPATWAARLVPLAAAAATLAAVAGLARLLWPERAEVHRNALLLAASGGLLLVFATLVRFDLLVTACATVALLGIALVRWRGPAAWVVVGLALGLGLIAKGPVVLVFALPPGLLAPLWLRERPPRGWLLWYGGLLCAVAAAAAIGLAWALPAASAGGTVYGDSLLWGQTADRVSGAHDHAHRFWFYLAALPVLLAPWLLWPAFWRGIAGQRHVRTDEGLRFCLVTLVAALLVMSAFSAKQIHYLLPALPVLALLVARLADGADEGRFGLMPVAGVLGFVGLAALLARLLGPALAGPHAAAFLAGIGLAGPLVLLAGAAAIALLGRRGRLDGPAGMLAATMVFLIALHLAGAGGIFARYDLAPAAEEVARHRQGGIAYGHDYAGEFGYLGRLTAPVEEVGASSFADWLAAHPGGAAVLHYRDLPADVPGAPGWQHPYRSGDLGIWLAPAS